MPLPILVWEDNLEYWRQLHAVIQTETSLAGISTDARHAGSQSGIQQGKPFNPDERRERLLEEAARTAVAEMRIVLYASRNPARIAWKDRAWEWFPLQLIDAQTGDFGASGFLDLESSDGYFFCGYGVSAAIGKPAVGAGSVYWLAFRDGTGAYLDGGKTYQLNVPGPVPGRLFWSMTIYDVDTRCLIATDQDQRRNTITRRQTSGERRRLLRSLLRPRGSGGQGSHVDQDHPGQRMVVRLPHLRTGSRGF